MRHTLEQLLLRLLRALFGLRVLRPLCLEEFNRAALPAEERYGAGFASGRALRRFACDPATEISLPFVLDALAHGDQCYAICEGGKLVTSSWYSTRPTPIGPAELVLHFAPGYVYMYKALTQPSHRGQRLYALGVSRALEHYRAKGARGLVCFVEAANLDSLKACLRMGARAFGWIYVVRIFGRHFAFSSRGCRAFGVRLEVAAPRTPRLFPVAPKAAPLGP